MREYQKIIRTIFVALFVGVGGVHAETLAEKMDANVATENNLANFELIAPDLGEKDREDAKLNEMLESNEAAQQLFYNNATDAQADGERFIAQSPISVEIFQNAPAVGKQFLLVRQNGRIRYVFAVSAGKGGTPGGDYGVIKRRWRHMSASYPGKGENNMDHVTYFKPMYGFHSTTFGLYSKLGTRDSHGCVRLARPQARAVFTLIKAYGGAAIYSYRAEKDPHESELRTVKKMLADDLNFIQKMLKNGNKGDVPFSEDQYYQYLAGQLDKKAVKDLLRRWGIAELLEVDEGRDRYPRGNSLR
ncbi:MAG TPA: L,D-transpeptidase [Bdellovibrionota bacterium]|jgi:lipoprotein-anchoring transpeptidase ErfK/SrfK|nr:L,D-transpeptidase [Bdellovibrionota bacterium]